MIELLIVFALATIGIYFTTTTPESMERSQVDEDQYDDETHEDEGGIGILGIDIGRKMKHVRRARIAARERVAMLRRNAEPVATAPEAEVPADTDSNIRSVLGGADWDEGGAGVAPVAAEAYEEDLPDTFPDATGPTPYETYQALAARAAQEEAAEVVGQEADPAEQAEADHDAPNQVTDAPVAEADEIDDEPAEEDDSAFNAAISAAIRAEFEEQEADRATAKRHTSRPVTRPAPTPASPPIIDEFDPDEDQIVIGYNRDEAGDGRIGITEDPTWPGTARVTLGGKVVALVPGGYGIVQAWHIELRPIDNAA